MHFTFLGSSLAISAGGRGLGYPLLDTEVGNGGGSFVIIIMKGGSWKLWLSGAQKGHNAH